jgi:hypothetical protein
MKSAVKEYEKPEKNTQKRLGGPLHSGGTESPANEGSFKSKPSTHRTQKAHEDAKNTRTYKTRKPAKDIHSPQAMDGKPPEEANPKRLTKEKGVNQNELSKCSKQIVSALYQREMGGCQRWRHS